MLKKRILLKISGEALMGETKFGLDVKTISYIANEIKEVYLNNYQICIHRLIKILNQSLKF